MENNQLPLQNETSLSPNPNPKKKNSSHLLKLILISFLMMILVIPTFLLFFITDERSGRNREAIEEVQRTWSGAQTLLGPVLEINYEKKTQFESWNSKLKKHVLQNSVENKVAYMMPEQAEIHAQVQVFNKKRGIFEIPVYESEVEIKGKISLIDFFAKTQAKNTEIKILNTKLLFAPSELKGLREFPQLSWNGQNILFEKAQVSQETKDIYNPESQTKNIQALKANVPLANQNDSQMFVIQVKLAGSSELNFLPIAKNNQVSIASNWPHPSFFGNYLPYQNKIDVNGFTASYSMSDLGRNFADLQWDTLTLSQSNNSYGIRFIKPVDIYQLNDRALKYAILFIFLTFTSFFIFEVLKKIKIHPLQYLLVGFSLCLFYLLLLSLSEHFGFFTAYISAAASVVILITSYVKSILKNRSHALLIASILTGLYSYLYTLLRAEDFALLLGSAGLFLILALIMFLTRKIDWSGEEKDEK